MVMLPNSEVSPYLSGSVLDNLVALVTSVSANRPNVMTVSFFAESSHVPSLLRVSIGRETLTYANIIEHGWFGLSVLARGQKKWALGCGTSSGRDRSKFEWLGIDYQTSARGVPLLPVCLTTSECRVVDRVELPGHTLFIGELMASFRQTRQAYREALLVSELMDS
jgi:flavin reductase (DIM6/NTAB) family NADH-FMN oxidoreductase RutF